MKFLLKLFGVFVLNIINILFNALLLYLGWTCIDACFNIPIDIPFKTWVAVYTMYCVVIKMLPIRKNKKDDKMEGAPTEAVAMVKILEQYANNIVYVAILLFEGLLF